jgi:chromosomal replication initiator protein
MDLNDFWKNVLGEVEVQVSRPNFVTWLKNSRLVNKQDGVALVSLPNSFAKEWVENKYHKILLGTLRNQDASVKKVEYLVHGNKLVIKALSSQVKPNTTIPTNQLSFPELKVDPETNLNPRYTLASFVVGSANELAHAASLAVIQEIGKKYNPLFIYGGVGVGKTHLIQAVGNEIKSVYKNQIRVRYVSSEKFTNEVVWAIRNKRMETIKEKYRGVDVLIIDDIQFIGGKARTEEEFFHTFNSLYENNKQIIISSDRSPKFLPTLSERLRSRFEGGMTCDIGYPDYELRVAVIKAKIEERNIALTDDLVAFIAGKTQKSFREVEGLLNRILFYQQTKQHPVTQKVLEKIVFETTQEPISKNLNPNVVIKTVAEFFGVSPSDLLNRCRKKEVVEPRQIVMFLLRDMLSLSYLHIGKKIGGRDHTTAIYAYEKIFQEITKNQALNHKILTIKELLSKS